MPKDLCIVSYNTGVRGDNESVKLASSSGSARSKLGSLKLDSNSGSARDLNEPSRARQSSARKAREQLDYYFTQKKIYIKKLFYIKKNLIQITYFLRFFLDVTLSILGSFKLDVTLYFG